VWRAVGNWGSAQSIGCSEGLVSRSVQSIIVVFFRNGNKNVIDERGQKQENYEVVKGGGLPQY